MSNREYPPVSTPVVIRDFRKAYGDCVAAAGVSFEVHAGELFGLLGPNGAGKTTTLESLEGLRKPDSGFLRIMGIDPISEPRKIRNLIGVQLQTSGLPETMSVKEAMKFFCAYHGIEPRFDLLDRLGLTGKANALYGRLSGGQQRRLTLTLAMVHKPPLLFLDEPTSGLDVPSRIELHNLMLELKTGGTTIVLATHDMAEAEKMADRVAILLRGKVAVIGTPRELTATGSGLTKISVRTENHSLCDSVVSFPAVSQYIFKDEYAIYFSTNPGATASAIISHIEGKGDALIDLRVERPSLEERFLELTSSRGDK
jgi:ABC-2 type transport system ATP-binding protein